MKRRTIRNLVMAAFFVPLSCWATYEVGYFGIFAVAVEGPGGMQVFADLCVSLTMLAPFLIKEARLSGRNPWPWILGILPLGSLSPLAFFLTQDLLGTRPQAAAPPSA